MEARIEDMRGKVKNLKEVSTRKDMLEIDPRLLEVQEGFNVRVDYGDIESLAQSIKENGVKVPLTVCLDSGHVYIRAGHRRHRAVMMLIERGEDIKAVKCINEGKYCTPEQSIFDLILSNDGKNLLPIEQGYAFLRLTNHGYSQTEIANKLGKAPAVVSNCITYATAPKEIQDMILSGSLKHSSALRILRLESSDEEKVNLCKKVLEAISGNGSGETETDKSEVVAEKEKTATTEGAKETPTEETERAKSQHQAVEGVLPENKRTPTTRIKELRTWLAENQKEYEDNSRFGLLQKVIDYVAGKSKLEDITSLI